MNDDTSDAKQAEMLAMAEAKKFDFEFRELISIQVIRPIAGMTRYRITIRLWDSQERIDAAISNSSDKLGAVEMRQSLLEGKMINIEVENSAVVGEKWIGIQLS